jgi:regulator of nucleoside diphosphate kinase
MSDLDLKSPPITITTEDMRRLNVRLKRYAPGGISGARDRSGQYSSRATSPRTVSFVCASRSSIARTRHGQVREAILVYPNETGAEGSCVSVLTSFGVVLIGLSVGQSIEFETPHGEKGSLTVLHVRD